jgi:penicillin-binding protein 1A
VKIANSVGVRKVVRRARRFGIRSPLRANLSITLGSSGVTLLELTSLYATIANRGRRIEPHVISFVMDSDGKSIWNATPAVTQSVPPEEAYVMLNLLENVVQSGTAVRARELKRPLAGKTGTTNDYHDAWLIGVSPQYSAGVWVGMDDKATIGRNETGGRAALPIWMKIMGAIHEGLPRLRFRRPAKVRFVSIDPHTGLRVPRGSEGSVRQAFVRGTEPSGNFSSPRKRKKSMSSFFREDATRRPKKGHDSDKPSPVIGDITTPIPSVGGPGPGPERPSRPAFDPFRPGQ